MHAPLDPIGRRRADWRRVRSLGCLIVPLLAVQPVGAEPENVILATADGFELSADYYRPPRPSAGAILILPDPQEDRISYRGLADSLAALGFHLLVIEPRGVGGSQMQHGIRRDRARFTARELVAAKLDAEEGVRYLRNLPATAIRAIALLGSGASCRAILDARADQMDRSARVLVSPSLQDDGEIATGESLLVVVSGIDVLGIESMARIRRESPMAECWLLDGAGRGADLMRLRQDLLGTLVAWIARSFG